MPVGTIAPPAESPAPGPAAPDAAPAPGARPRTVLIVGGGLAGIAAALRLAEAGVRVTLLETRKKLGGRATSFTDVRSGQTLDNCQHVVLGCCTNYLDLLRRMRVDDAIRWTREQYWIEQGGRVSIIRPSPFPAPAHFAPSILRAPMFTRADTVALARACSAILRIDRRKHQSRTFAELLADLRQPEHLVRRFWSPVVISACNLDVDKVAASSALHVFQEGFLAAARSADVGVAAVPLVELYRHVPDIITQAGGRIVLGAGVERLTARSVLTTDGGRFDADAVICAVPVERAARLVDDPTRAADPRFAAIERFTHSPILGVHLEFDRPALPEFPHAVLVDRPTQWLFRKDDAGTRVHAVISAADAWVDLDEQTIADRVLADMRACLPAFQPRSRVDQPTPVRVRAVKEKLATFAPTPGLDAHRPSPTGPSGIILAGDYTNTGWPATMEGATRSGYAAAAAALALPAADLLVPPLRIAPLATLLGLRATPSN